jgi:hypothetical protein
MDKIYAVLTGDLERSGKLQNEELEQARSMLRGSSEVINNWNPLARAHWHGSKAVLRQFEKTDWFAKLLNKTNRNNP